VEPKVAIVHDWVTALGGAERCLAAFLELFPGADLYTLVYQEASVRRLGLDPKAVHASFVQRLPRGQVSYPLYLPLYPLAIESFNLDGYDIILSSSWAAAKGVLTRSDQLHICYCHTPIRYAWDLRHDYLKREGVQRGLKGLIARLIMHYIRLWDVGSASRVDSFVANSRYVARRIRRIYGRHARVIYPPVEVTGCDMQGEKADYFLFVSRLVPYKRLDLVIEAFGQLGLPLAVVGDGPERRRLERLAPPNVRFLGWQPDAEVRRQMGAARALIYAADEDFGITPVEAQACGTPVIAYGKGGVTETVIPWEAGPETATGLFFEEQTAESLARAVGRFLAVEGCFSRAAIRANAERFSRERFDGEVRAYVARHWEIHRARHFGGTAAR
jgi:glycosyltransferase involved in cell wall biosynthesis